MSILLIGIIVGATVAWMLEIQILSALLIIVFILLFVGSVLGFVPKLLYPIIRTGDRRALLDFGDKNILVVPGIDTVRTEIGNHELTFYSLSRLVLVRDVYELCVAQGADCTIIITGGITSPGHPSETELMVEMLVSFGLPREDMITDTLSRSTWENASNAAKLMQRIEHDRIFAISSNLHMSRFQMYLKHFGFPSCPLPSDHLYPRISIIPGRLNYLVADIIIHELFGIARYKTYTILGINDT